MFVIFLTTIHPLFNCSTDNVLRAFDDGIRMFYFIFLFFFTLASRNWPLIGNTVTYQLMQAPLEWSVWTNTALCNQDNHWFEFGRGHFSYFIFFLLLTIVNHQQMQKAIKRLMNKHCINHLPLYYSTCMEYMENQTTDHIILIKISELRNVFNEDYIQLLSKHQVGNLKSELTGGCCDCRNSIWVAAVAVFANEQCSSSITERKSG